MGSREVPAAGRTPSSPQRYAGLALACVLLLLGALLVTPSASAIHNDIDIGVIPWAKECDGGWDGFTGGPDKEVYRACHSFDWKVPDYPARFIQGNEYPPNVTQGECPSGFDGYILQHRSTRAGACVTYDHQAPSFIWPALSVHLSGCEVPDRERNGSDPAVHVVDGGAAVCVFPVLEPGHPPPGREVDLDPCEPETVDPKIWVAGGGLEVCLEFHVLGYGSEEIAEWMAILDTFVSATVRILIGLLPVDAQPYIDLAWERVPDGIKVLIHFAHDASPIDPTP